MYTIGLNSKLIQMYIDTINLHFKVKLLMYILSLEHKKKKKDDIFH